MQYQEGQAATPDAQACACGTFAIGRCQRCDRAICGSHSSLQEGVRVCGTCSATARAVAARAADDAQRQREAARMTVAQFLEAAQSAGNPGLRTWTLHKTSSNWKGARHHTKHDGTVEMSGWRLGHDHVLELSGRIAWFWSSAGLLVKEGTKPKWKKVSLADQDLPNEGMIFDPSPKSYLTHGASTRPITPERLDCWLQLAAERHGIPVAVQHSPWRANPSLISIARFTEAASAVGNPGLRTWKLQKTKAVLKSRIQGAAGGYKTTVVDTFPLTGWLLDRQYVLEPTGLVHRSEPHGRWASDSQLYELEKSELDYSWVQMDYQVGGSFEDSQSIAIWLDRLLRQAASEFQIPLEAIRP